MQDSSQHAATVVISIIVLLLIIDITLMIWAFYCLVDCYDQKLISLPLALLLGLLVFIPAFGFIVPVGIIIYHAVYCKKQHGAIAVPTPSSPAASFMFF